MTMTIVTVELFWARQGQRESDPRWPFPEWSWPLKPGFLDHVSFLNFSLQPRATL